MPRKNGNANRRKVKGRIDRREAPMPKLKPRVSIPLEELVIHDGRCTLQRAKARFATKEKADKALRQAQIQRPTGHVEKRVYKCPEGGCGGYHLTSRESFTERKVSA